MAEMDSSRLMNRTDHKFLFTPDKLIPLFDRLIPDYRVLTINDTRSFTYQSFYFDTPELEFYRLHHSGKKNRHKVRFREYVESRTTFLEVKYKNNKGRTIKNRVVVDSWEKDLSAESKRFIQDISGLKVQLEYVLQNNFNRITLVNKNAPERVTFDFNLSYDCNEQRLSFDHIVIAEVKQSSFSRQSPIMTALKELRCYPDSISKYCLGIYSCYPNIKHNRFKKHLLKIRKMKNANAA